MTRSRFPTTCTLASTMLPTPSSSPIWRGGFDVSSYPPVDVRPITLSDATLASWVRSSSCNPPAK